MCHHTKCPRASLFSVLRIFLILWHTLCSKLDDGSASMMRIHHLISNTNHTMESRHGHIIHKHTISFGKLAMCHHTKCPRASLVSVLTNPYANSAPLTITPSLIIPSSDLIFSPFSSGCLAMAKCELHYGRMKSVVMETQLVFHLWGGS